MSICSNLYQQELVHGGKKMGRVTETKGGVNFDKKPEENKKKQIWRGRRKGTGGGRESGSSAW
jgi:hypothetical protein